MASGQTGSAGNRRQRRPAAAARAIGRTWRGNWVPGNRGEGAVVGAERLQDHPNWPWRIEVPRTGSDGLGDRVSVNRWRSSWTGKPGSGPEKWASPAAPFRRDGRC